MTIGSEGVELTVCAIPVPVDVEYPYRTLVSHPLLCDTDDLVIIFAESNTFDSCRELPSEEAFPGLHRPEAEGVVGRATD